MNFKSIYIIIILILILINPIVCNGQELTVMIALDEKVPSEIQGLGYDEIAEFLKENNFEIILFPEGDKVDLTQLINQLMNNNDTKLAEIAKNKGALFLICGKLQAMETGTTTVYDTTLYELELFGEIKLITLTREDGPLSINLKEKGLSVKLQESYQQALGKALESIEKTILSEFKILNLEK